MVKSDSLGVFLARRDASFLALFVGLLGTCGIAVAILSLVKVPVLHSDAQRAEATVTKLERVFVDVDPGPGPGPKPGFDHVPVVRFQDGSRQVEVRVTNVVHPVGKFSVGQKVSVVYRAGRPEEARIPSFFEFYLPTLVFGGVGIIFDLIALALWTAIRRNRNAPSTGVGPEPTGDADSGV
jgi:uncharacterized protein DUF3592